MTGILDITGMPEFPASMDDLEGQPIVIVSAVRTTGNYGPYYNILYRLDGQPTDAPLSAGRISGQTAVAQLSKLSEAELKEGVTCTVRKHGRSWYLS